MMNYFGGSSCGCGCAPQGMQYTNYMPCGCGNYMGGNNTSYYAIILVLFILLVIVISSRFNR